MGVCTSSANWQYRVRLGTSTVTEKRAEVRHHHHHHHDDRTGWRCSASTRYQLLHISVIIKLHPKLHGAKRHETLDLKSIRQQTQGWTDDRKTGHPTRGTAGSDNQYEVAIHEGSVNKQASLPPPARQTDAHLGRDRNTLYTVSAGRYLQGTTINQRSSTPLLPPHCWFLLVCDLVWKINAWRCWRGENGRAILNSFSFCPWPVPFDWWRRTAQKERNELF